MSAKWHAVISCVGNWEDRRSTRNVVRCKRGNFLLVAFYISSILNFKIFLMQCHRALETGTPAASFIKFTTNLLSAAIKDAVFVEGNERPQQRQSSSGEKKGPFLRSSSKAHPEQAGQPARRPFPPLPRRPQPRSPDGACSPISRSVSRPRFRSGRGRGKERGSGIGRSDAPSKTDRENGRRRPPAAERSLPPATVRPSVGGAMGITATDRPFAR